MTEREELAQTARAARLNMTAADLDALLPAWKRYRALVEALRDALTPDLVDA